MIQLELDWLESSGIWIVDNQGFRGSLWDVNNMARSSLEYGLNAVIERFPLYLRCDQTIKLWLYFYLFFAFSFSIFDMII